MNLAILVLICCSVVVSANAAAAAAAGNHTMLLNSDEAGVEEVEFLMESGSSMRMLQQGSKNVYRIVLDKQKPNYHCGEANYYCSPDLQPRKLYCAPGLRDKLIGYDGPQDLWASSLKAMTSVDYRLCAMSCCNPDTEFFISASEFSFSSIGSVIVFCKLKPQLVGSAGGGGTVTMKTTIMNLDVKKATKFLLTIPPPGSTINVEVSEKDKALIFSVEKRVVLSSLVGYRELPLYPLFPMMNVEEKEYLATVTLCIMDFYKVICFLESYTRDDTRGCISSGFRADSSAGTDSDEGAKVLVSLEGVKICVKGHSIFYKKEESVKKLNVKKPMSFIIPCDVLGHQFDGVFWCSDSVTISAYPKFPVRLEFPVTNGVIVRWDILNSYDVKAEGEEEEDEEEEEEEEVSAPN
ncbi:hypothetical protein LINPERPRIM_LOCUS1770 [Linum perenne]